MKSKTKKSIDKARAQVDSIPKSRAQNLKGGIVGGHEATPNEWPWQ